MKPFRRTSKAEVPRRRIQREDDPRPSLESANQFRRNQTLSQARHSHDEPQSERARYHQLAARRRKAFAILGLVFGVVIILGLLLTQLTAQLSVTRSSVPLSQPVDAQRYETLINQYFGLNPVERLRFVLNEERLSSYVAASAPEVLSVSLTGTTGVIQSDFTVTLREPVAGWQINGRQYFVDATGVVFEKNYYNNPTVQIIDQSGVSPDQGQTVASSRLLSFVGRVVALSAESTEGRGRVVTQAILPVGTTRQLEFRIEGVQPFVKMTIDRGAGEQVEDMKRVLNYLGQRNLVPAYIDVRVESRATYRY